MQTTNSIETSAIGKITWRLVPFLGLMFFINFLDRTAIGFAGPNGMTQDLGLTAAQFGFAAGIFFVGYIALEIPSNLALHKFGARKWLARIMVTWGIVSLLFTFVQSATQLYWLRFLLGVAEAGFFPGAILFLSMWVPARHRAKVLAVFYVAQPLTTVIGAPIASALIEAHGAFGLEGWRIMFFGVSVPAIIVGIITFFYLPDTPNDARWLTREDLWLALAIWTLAPESRLAAFACAVAGVLNGARLVRWRGLAVRSESLLFVLHAAYAFVPLGFLALSAAGMGLLMPASALHVLTVGEIATMMLAVMTRATRGHTGRDLTASRVTTLSYLCLFAAALARPLADLTGSAGLMEAAGLLWILSFGLFVAEHGAMLVLQRRQAGRLQAARA